MFFRNKNYYVKFTEALSIVLNNNVKISRIKHTVTEIFKAFKAISLQKVQPPLSLSILYAFIFHQKNSVNVKT